MGRTGAAVIRHNARWMNENPGYLILIEGTPTTRERGRATGRRGSGGRRRPRLLSSRQACPVRVCGSSAMARNGRCALRRPTHVRPRTGACTSARRSSKDGSPRGSPEAGRAPSGTRPGSSRAEYPVGILSGGSFNWAPHVIPQKPCQRRAVRFWRDLSKRHLDGRVEPMTKPAGTLFAPAAMAILAEVRGGQSQFPESFGSDRAGERGPDAVLVAPVPRWAR